MCPGGGGNLEQSAPNPCWASLGLEMAAPEAGSFCMPARRPRLPTASPVLPRDCDSGSLALSSDSWGFKAPGTSSPARLWETVSTQVRLREGRGKTEAVDGVGLENEGEPFLELLKQQAPSVGSSEPASLLPR